MASKASSKKKNDKNKSRKDEKKKRRHEGRGSKNQGPAPSADEKTTAIGVVARTKTGWTLLSADKRDKEKYVLRNASLAEANEGALVRVTASKASRGGKTEAVIDNVIGAPDDPKTISEIALQANAIPSIFPPAALAEAKRARPVELGAREDLRAIPLVTIDGEDARDFDDAVFAEPDQDGFHMIVAIADVAHYVKAGSALDDEAQLRGNSTYLPDRVVPMLPEELSNGLCSLKPNEDRACLAAHIWISAKGEILRGGFSRALMRSAARLTYNQVQRTLDGHADGVPHDLAKTVIEPLHAAYRCLAEARERRGTLELDLPERRVALNDDGTVKAIELRRQTEANKLIEEFMIAANVLAATTLRGTGMCIYRVHDAPGEIKMGDLAAFLETLGIHLPKQHDLTPAQLTHVLEMTAKSPLAPIVHEMMLRSLAQAVYSPENIGHFGLALPEYAHFTSPIRRYADLIVHRALIRKLGLGKDGLNETQQEKLSAIATHISGTERTSAMAERDAVDRFTALYLAERVGVTFDAHVSGATRFGLFIRTQNEGAEGLVPFNALPGGDYYNLDQKRQALVGERTGRVFQLGQEVKAKLEEADPLTGAIRFSIIDPEAPAPQKKPALGRKGRPAARL
jgi:ribonuclease R